MRNSSTTSKPRKRTADPIGVSSTYRFRADRLIPDGAVAMAWDPLRDAVVELTDNGRMRPARPLPSHGLRWTLRDGLLWQAEAHAVEVRGFDGALRERWTLATTSIACFGAHVTALGADRTLWILGLGDMPAPAGRVDGVPLFCDGEYAWLRSSQTVDVVHLASGAVVARRPVGGPYVYPRIDVDADSMFVRIPPERRGQPERIEELDRCTLEPVGEVEVATGWTAIAVVDGNAIIVPRRHPGREPDLVEPNLFWIDVRTGRGIGAVTLEHEPQPWSAVSGVECVWAFARRALDLGGWIPLRVPSRPGMVWAWDLSDADVAALRSPSPPSDAAGVEERALADLSAELSSGWREHGTGVVHPFITGISFVDFRLERSWPDTVVAAVFDAQQRPGFRFVRRFRIWAADGKPDDLTCDAINLMEDVEACGLGLPSDPAPGDDGLVAF